MEPVEDEEDEFSIEIGADGDDEGEDRDERRRRRRSEFKSQFRREFNSDNLFGPGGPFGAAGPFALQGVFGPGGLFGKGGMMGGGGRGGRHRGEMHGGPRQRRQRMFGSGELRLVLLAMLAEEPRHGYELIKALEELTDGAYSPSPGTIYPTLQMLADEGVIAEQESEDARKLYRATDAGTAELLDRKDELEELWHRLGRRFEKRAERERSGGQSAMFRALGNLASVITNKAASGGVTMDKDQVIDLIDELARKIERM
ncbi:MAG: PadR family transcriptional regulator [Erythrobacter sp.]|nr:MAG: PadR family transcriptional regulator [Erythrobacter sp.]